MKPQRCSLRPAVADLILVRLMAWRFLLMAIVSAVIACEAVQPDIVHTSGRFPYSRSAYQRGRTDAKADLRAGRLILIVENHGFPRPNQELESILRRRYNIEVRRVPSWTVDSTVFGHAYGYD